MHRSGLLAVVFLTVASPALAAEERTEEDDKGIFNVVLENDVFAGTDRDYTNGIRFSWISSEDNMPNWARTAAHLLPLASDGNKRISIAADKACSPRKTLPCATRLQATALMPVGFTVLSAWYRIRVKRSIMSCLH